MGSAQMSSKTGQTPQLAASASHAWPAPQQSPDVSDVRQSQPSPGQTHFFLWHAPPPSAQIVPFFSFAHLPCLHFLQRPHGLLLPHFAAAPSGLATPRAPPAAAPASASSAVRRLPRHAASRAMPSNRSPSIPFPPRR